MSRLRTSVNKLDTIFIVALLALFAITAFVLVLVGVKQYKLTAKTMNHNYETRTVTSYLKEKVHQSDYDSSISVTDFYGTKALTISSTVNDSIYYTYIYFYNGYLRELFVEENSVFSPDSGLEIISISGFTLETIASDLVKATITDTNGNDICIYLSKKSSN